MQISTTQISEAIDQLKQFVAIKSVGNTGSPDYDPSELENAANFTAIQLRDLGFGKRMRVRDRKLFNPPEAPPS